MSRRINVSTYFHKQIIQYEYKDTMRFAANHRLHNTNRRMNINITEQGYKFN